MEIDFPLLQVDDLVAAFAGNLPPSETLSLDAWADEFRILPQISSSEHGPWRTSRFPYLKEIMWELSPESPTQMVVVQKGAQLGFTECAVNLMLYTVDHTPAPLLYVQKTIEAVEKFSKQRLAPSIEICPSVFEKFGGLKSRDGTNTIRMKTYPGGALILGGANSAASLRSMPIQNLILDEEESYDADIEDEGNPSEIAIRRTANFPRRKIFRPSTPTVKETSKIEPLFISGDQRSYYVPCPICGAFQTIQWPNIVWDDEDATSVRLRCVHCKQEITENYKTEMLSKGEWRKKFPGRKVASFFINSLYSPLGFFSWMDAAEMFITAQKERDRNKLKVFVNTVLAETWSEAKVEISLTGLMKRKEEYPVEVPEGVLVLTAGVDVQEDRVECEVVGWGKGQESWSIEYVEFMGDTEHSFVWEQLDQYLQKTWLHASGHRVNLACTAVDSGHRAKVVYNFCRLREVRRIFAVKGRYGWGQGYIRRPKKRNEHGVYLFLTFVDEIKSKIYSALQLTTPGMGYCHFPENPKYDRNHFAALTAERLVQKKSHGRVTLEWELPQGARNEPLDCRVYNLAALNILNPNFEYLGQKGPLIFGNSRLKKTRVHSRGF